jgi:hypothetical protein
MESEARMESQARGLIKLQGQVCRVRSLSKRLVFFDVLLDNEAAEVPAGATASGAPAAGADAAAAAAAASAHRERWVEVIAKASEFDRVQAARDAIRIGDVVRFTGDFQDPPANALLTCRGFDVLRRWRDAGGGRSFQPRIPPSRHHSGSGGGHAHQQAAADAAVRAQPALAQGGREAVAGGAPSAGQQQQGAGRGQHQDHNEQQQQQQQQEEEEGEGRPQGLCKFFLNSGTCLKGVACPYAHVAPDARGAALASWVKRRCAGRAAAARRGPLAASARCGRTPQAQLVCVLCRTRPPPAGPPLFWSASKEQRAVVSLLQTSRPPPPAPTPRSLICAMNPSPQPHTQRDMSVGLQQNSWQNSPKTRADCRVQAAEADKRIVANQCIKHSTYAPLIRANGAATKGLAWRRPVVQGAK